MAWSHPPTGHLAVDSWSIWFAPVCSTTRCRRRRTSTNFLAASLGYIHAEFAFKDAIRTARKSGTSDSEIAHIIGYSVPMLEAVAGRARQS